MLQYRKAITNFQAAAAERANVQLESSLQMELLSRISRSQRGLASSHGDRLAILDLIERLEDAQAATQVPAAGDVAAATEAAKEAAAAVEEAQRIEESVEGEWHLEFVSSAADGVQDGWDFTGSTDLQKKQRVSRSRQRASVCVCVCVLKRRRRRGTVTARYCHIRGFVFKSPCCFSFVLLPSDACKQRVRAVNLDVVLPVMYVCTTLNAYTAHICQRRAASTRRGWRRVLTDLRQHS